MPSDLHLRHHQAGTSWLSSRQSRRVPELLALALREICQMNIDLLAVTGDLPDMPSEAVPARPSH